MNRQLPDKQPATSRQPAGQTTNGKRAIDLQTDKEQTIKSAISRQRPRSRQLSRQTLNRQQIAQDRLYYSFTMNDKWTISRQAASNEAAAEQATDWTDNKQIINTKFSDRKPQARMQPVRQTINRQWVSSLQTSSLPWAGSQPDREWTDNK